jgi:hypothetical protein
MKAVKGQHFITRNHGSLAIYVYESVDEHGSRASKVKNCDTFEEAVREMYRLNGWAEPKGGFRFDNK